MNIFLKTLSACALAFAGFTHAEAQIEVYPVPQQIYYAKHIDDYTVRVRQSGTKEWIDLYEYKVKVDMDTNSDATMVQFGFSGSVDVLVEKNNGHIDDVCIRPLSRKIKARKDGNSIMFTLDKPEKLSIEFNGDRLHNLHLFANAVSPAMPEAGQPGTMHFNAGYHVPQSPDKCFHIPSNTTVYIENGAIFKGPFVCDSVENVNIIGNGIVLETSNGMTISHSRNVTVDGLTFMNPRYNSITTAVSSDITLRNIKSFSSQGWGDGLDFFCCTNVTADSLFMRNSDDCIAIYGHRWDYYGNTSGIRITNSTLWADIAHPVNIGTHGDTSHEGETLENIEIKNIDILEHDEDDPDYQGCIAINTGDHNLVRNVLVDGLRVEHIQEGQLFHLRVMFNKKYNTGPGRTIENVTFRNVSCSAPRLRPSLIEGYDSLNTVRNISFENIHLNGKKIKTLEKLNIKRANSFTSDITIK